MNERKGFLLLLITALFALSFLMLKPFLVYILGAVILAFILHPVFDRIRGYTGDMIGAGLMVFLAIFVAIMPIILTTAFVMEDARGVASDLSDIDNINFASVNIDEIEQRIFELTGQQMNIEETLSTAIEGFVSITAGNFSQILGFFTDIFIGLSIMLFLLYYMVRDGEEFIEWLKGVIPMPAGLTNSLLGRVDKTTWAVIKGHVLVAIIQGLVAGLGLALAGVPNFFFWTFIMVILSFIPLIGSGLVWAPAVIYLFVMNRTGPAIFLLLYSAIVVGLTDNFLRPLLVDEEADLHPATILIGVVGGVFLLGAPGLFVGPIILGVLKSTLMVFKNNYEEL